MESSRKEEFDEKLIFALRKLTESKKFDETFIDRFLINIKHEFCHKHENISHIPGLSEWLLEIIQKWRQNELILSETVFVCKFIGILGQYEHSFELLLHNNAINEFINALEPIVFENTALKSVYILFLTQVLNHTSGYHWVKATKLWKVVSSLYFSNSNLYIERNGLDFFKKFLNRAAFNDELCNEVLQEICFHISKYNEVNIEDKNFCSVVLLFLKLMQSLLKINVFSQSHIFCLKIIKIFDVQIFLNFIMENCKQEIILEEASILKILFFVSCYEDKKELLSLGDIPVVLDLFYVMIKQNLFNGIIKLAKYCLVLWSEMRKEIQCESKAGVHFIIIQLLPAIICIKPPDTALCDLYIQKLFSLTSIRAQKFCYLFRDEIRSKVSFKLKNLALKSVLSVIGNTECLNLEEAVIIFQSMAYILKTFIPDNMSPMEPGKNKSGNETSLCMQDTPLLLAVLNALCVYIEKFKINWPESLESLCLLKMTCILLENEDLSSVVIVQIFLLVKLLILNFMSPDLALLMNITKDSSFDCLMPLLFRRLHDPNWEIRDSCLEIVTAIAELSESKYPAFQQLLVEKDFCSLVVDIMERDSESYVRASAIQALSTMTKIETFNIVLIKMDFPQKIIQLLQNESEAIVRREAALVIKQIYLTLNDPHDEIVISFYEIMGYLAVSDLHWEVKINSLIFWEAVIQRIITDQGMIDGSFPKVTFSKEHKKIVNLTKDEVKIRLDKVLRKLSDIGCLYVLLSCLNEDCDMLVIKKSAQILSDFITILKRYEVMKSSKDLFICERVTVKRKSTVLDSCEKRKTLSLITRQNCNDGLNETSLEEFNNEQSSASSDVIIDGIVNEMDINLLVSVCSQKEKIEGLQKKLLFHKIKPEAFLLQMQDFEMEKFLEDKQKWLVNLEMDLKSVSETCVVNMIDETNLMDCY